MTAKEQLQAVRCAQVEVERLNKRLEQFREQAQYGSSTISALNNSGTSQRSRVEENVCKIYDAELEYMQKANEGVDYYIDLKAEAENTIRQMPYAKHQQLLRMYYFQAKTWGEIARKMQYSIRQIHRMHGHALQAFAQTQKRLEKQA